MNSYKNLFTTGHRGTEKSYFSASALSQRDLLPSNERSKALADVSFNEVRSSLGREDWFVTISSPSMLVVSNIIFFAPNCGDQFMVAGKFQMD